MFDTFDDLLEAPFAMNDNKLSEERVIEYLLEHSDFLKKNPEVMALQQSSARSLSGVEDFQFHQLKTLQDQHKQLREKYDSLVEFCRTHISLEHQVHEAALRIARVHSLENLFETLAIDFTTLFEVDVVRLALESPVADEMEKNYGEENMSGAILISPGLTDMLVQNRKQVVIVENLEQVDIPGLDEIFADCHGSVMAAALLRVELPSIKRNAMLAFGTREPGRFVPAQGVEMLLFLAQLVADKCDHYLAME